MSEHKYEPIDKYVWLNTGDLALTAIPVDQFDLWKRVYRQFGMEEPTKWPDPETIEGYGLPKSEQKFKREVTPQALVELEKSVRHELRPKGKARDLSPVRMELSVINRFWEILDEQQEKYQAEIDWISKMWYYRLFGKHLYINGKHTYITNDHWFYCNYWNLTSGYLADYRDRDRRWHIALKYCELTTEMFDKVHPETGLPIPESDGTFLMRDLGKRVCYGMNNPKMRREGATSRFESANVNFISRKMGGKSAIQAKDDDTASMIFSEHAVQPFIKLPIFWKPIFDAAGGIAPKNTLLFDSLEDVNFGLHSQLEVASSSNKSKLDSRLLHFFHGDEFGKLERSNPNDIIDVIKFCMSTGAGNNIFGLGCVTSTVDEIVDQSAGQNYQQFCNRSLWDIRDDSGQTQSGFFTIFFSSVDGLEGFIGPYGESIIDDPTPEQALFIGKTIGARKFIEGKIAGYRRQKDFTGLATFRRQYPLTYNDCFVPPPSQQLLRRDLIEAQISYLNQNPASQAIRGDLYWKNGIDSEVGWLPNNETGRFYLSKYFQPGETNRRVRRDNMWWPAVMDKYLASADTFGVDKTLGRKSNGSILVHWLRDKIVDPMDKELELIESDRDILTYSFRPDTVNEYVDDVIKAIVYTGAMLYPERNKESLFEGIRRRGYGGYLLYNYNHNTGKQDPSPGFWNKNELMDDAIRWLQQDIVVNIKRYYHLDLLNEMLDFGGRHQLTNLDLMVSKLGVLIGQRNQFYNMVGGHNNTYNVSDWIPWETE